MAGYAFAKMRFPGKDALFLLVLMTLMVPFAATLIPLFIIVRDLDLTNTYPGLILPALASPIGIFMMRQFIESLPNDLENAARLDGCSEFQIFRRIILPLIKPGLVVLGVFTFMNAVDELSLAAGDQYPAGDADADVGSPEPALPVHGQLGHPLGAARCSRCCRSILVFIFLQRYLHRRLDRRRTEG